MANRYIEDTLVWANDLSEIFTSTTAGRILDSHISRVKVAKHEDPELAGILVLELAKTCNQLEQDREKMNV